MFNKQKGKFIMKFKRLLILFCVLAMCVGTCAPAFADTASSGDEITVLFTHDLHSHLLPAANENGKGE